MKRIILIFFVNIMLCISGFAKEPQRPTSYNYQRGLEALLKEYDPQKALDYLNKELDNNPKCGYTYAWIAHIRLSQEEFGRAMTCANSAIKFLPKNDKQYTSWAYSLRAEIYANLEDTAAAIKDYSQAIKIAPENHNYYSERADLYFYTKQYALADADYQKMLKINENEAVIQAYMGLGRNLKEQDKDAEAIECFNKVITLYGNEYSSAYSFRAECMLKLKRYEEAVYDIVKALEIDNDEKAYYMLLTLEDKEAVELMNNKLKLQCVFNPKMPIWKYYQGIFLEVQKRYKDAIEAYLAANVISHSEKVDERISECYESLGDYGQALKYINYVIDADSTIALNYYKRGNIYGEMGNRDMAIKEMTKSIELSPKLYHYYYRRGWFYLLDNQLDNAIEDLTLAITLNPDYNYSYDERGRAYLLQGKTDLAKADFEKLLTIDTVPEDNSCTAFAYHFLGQDDKATDWLRKTLEKDSTAYYNAVCLYSLVGQTDSALFYLHKAFDNGFVRFEHLKVDRDVDNIRNLDEYKLMVKEYEQRLKESLEVQDSTSTSEQRIVEVPFSKSNGVTKVDCTINGLPLNFVFDTGASDVTISQVEANFMFKNGYLDGKDMIGSQRYQTADGNISVGTTINLRQINFGGLELHDVRASVVKSQNAPLLLGQTVLQRLGKIEIDNEKRVLKITTR